MKNIFLIIGILLVLINTAFGFVLASYEPFNMWLANGSIMLSAALLYGTYASPMADGFKIGFTLFFSITGFVRLICSVVSSDQLENNFAFLFFIVLIAIEVLCFFIGYGLSKK